MQTYSKQREKSALVKHYHQEQLKRLQKKLGQIRNRKKGLLPENKQNSLPILPPRYILPITRQLQISDQNDRLGNRIAEMKTKQSQYFRKILKQKQKVKNIEYNQRNRKQSKKVKLIYSGSLRVSGLLANFGNVTMREDILLDGNRSGLLRAVTQSQNKKV